jgi:Zn-dependent protease
MLIAIVFSLYIRSLGDTINTSPAGHIAVLIVLVNLTLALFNLIPIPPLDGFKIFFGLLPYRFRGAKEFVERNMLFFMLIVIVAISFVLDPIIGKLFSLMTGVALG